VGEFEQMPLDAYLAELARRLHDVLGEDLTGVYAGGSYALGAYEPGRSDVDVTAVARGPLSHTVKRGIVERVRHEALPCPARGLELVVYPLETARGGGGEPGFELNLNTGARMPFRVDEAPGDIEGFWFAIDRAILREHGIALLGPAPAEVFAPIPRTAVLRLLGESVRWHRGEAGQPTASDAVLNTARALRFAAEGAWAPKRAAGEWAAREPVVRAALDGAPLDPGAVARFLDDVAVRLDQADLPA
jgi:Domain of unknown function (DUF4111)/Nucleotidyltransferase domain